MNSSLFARKLATVVIATFMATAAVAEDMSLPGPGSDCLSKAQVQLSLDNARCVGSYPVTTQLYSECIANAQRASWTGALDAAPAGGPHGGVGVCGQRFP